VLGALVRRHYRHTLTLPAGLSLTRTLSRLGVLAIVADLVGWMILLGAASADENVLLQGAATKWLYVLYCLGCIALLGVLGVLAHAARSLQVRSRSPVVLAGELLLALAALYLAWFIPVFGLVSFNARF
jgi:hypothetical protein